MSNNLSDLPPRFRRESLLAGIGAVVPYVLPLQYWTVQLQAIFRGGYPSLEMLYQVLVSGVAMLCAPLAFVCFFAALYRAAAPDCSMRGLRLSTAIATILIAASGALTAMRGFQILATHPGHADLLEQQLAIELPLCVCWTLLFGSFAVFADPLTRLATFILAGLTLLGTMISGLRMTVGVVGDWIDTGMAGVGIVRVGYLVVETLGFLMVAVLLADLARSSYRRIYLRPPAGSV